MLNPNTTLPDKMQQVIGEYLLNKVYTCLPARITSVADFATNQTVNLKTSIKRVYPDGLVDDGAVLDKVPIIFPSAGGGLLSFPVKVGDTVLVCFSKQCMDEWNVGGGEDTTPRFNRQFDISDPIAIAGLYTSKSHLNPNPDHVELKFKGNTVLLRNDGSVLVDSPTEVTVSGAAQVNILSNGTVTVSGDVVNVEADSVNVSASAVAIEATSVEITSTTLTHNGINIGSDHTHSGVTSGPSFTGPPVP